MWEINGYDVDYYGNYRNKKFTDFYPTFEDFADDYVSSGFFDKIPNPDPSAEPPLIPGPEDIGHENLMLLWRLLYARYGNSTIADSDVNQFRFRLFSIIFQYGPTWVKELEIQRKVRGMSETDLAEGNTQIFNHAYNPATDPTTQTTEQLQYINEQNVSKTKRSKLDQYDYVLQLLKRDVTEDFINKFKVLFLKIVAPEVPLWYEED